MAAPQASSGGASAPQSVTVVVAGRNDDYGGDFRERLFRTAHHNSIALSASGLDWEYLLIEWNPLTDRPLLSTEFVARVPRSRAIVVPSTVHDAYSRHPGMPFHEMPAKNAGLRRVRSDWAIVTNADVLFSPEALVPLAAGSLDPRTLYRARRVDVRPDLSWEAMQDPAQHLPSGEGVQYPVPYLGAGGDFCLASTALWHELAGFDERVRFTTRAKDWQFFLSALHREIRVEFLGSVFHLDHAGGFRNTPDAVRRTAAAHFGGPWDIEFGLPTRNPEHWGLGALRSSSPDHPAIEVLTGSPAFTVKDQLEADALQDLTAGADPDWLSTAWLHIIYAAWRARRSLFVELQNPRAAALLSGYLPIARDAGVDISGPWRWAPLSGFELNGPSYARHAGAGAWIVREHDGLLTVTADGVPLPIWPVHRAPAAPVFNPLLARRLLRSWIQLSRAGVRTVAIYGAGSHTREVLSFGWPDDQHVVTLVTSDGSGQPMEGLPVAALDDLPASAVDALVLSSAAYERDMAAAARARGFERIAALYDDWLNGVGMNFSFCHQAVSRK